MSPENYLGNYQKSHTHRINRWLHVFGIPMIVVSLPLFFWRWPVALGLFISGWALQFIGHGIEGNTPAFFKSPRYLLVGPLWWVKKIFHKKKD